jgi:alkylated DNA repair dioxygenase AlkB
MDLFTSNNNILPYDGETLYYGHILDSEKAHYYFDALLHTVAWKHDEAIIYGKHYITKRKVAWYGNQSYNYTYSNTTKQALPWTPELITLKQLVEGITGTEFNSCLLNLYHTGEEGMAWHSDDEKALGHNTVIASVSLGAARKFSFKHKLTAQKCDIILEPGSLLVMKGCTQTHWLHRLAPSKKVKAARINLTFRTISQ